MHRIEACLRREIGLDAASIGSSLIERTIRLRMKLHGLRHIGDYHALLETCRAECDELIETVVVTETWFFRDREPFNAFLQIVLGEWLPRHPDAGLRVLSVPCASGEEPYSLAMALLDAGVPNNRFAIDAVDISTNALARAQRAIYGRNSFRGKDLAFRDRHFMPTQDGYALSPLAQRCVSFRRDNLLDAGFLAGSAPYDFIFCRNLLIYFDRATQTRALAQLHRLLRPEGVLFVGAAELPLVSEGGFVTANLPLAFACRKAGSPATGAPHDQPRKTSRRAPVAPAPAPPPVNHDNGNGGTLPESEGRTAVSPAANGSAATLESARQLADAGKLAEAAAACETVISRGGPSAPAYYLLGLVKDAADDAEAAAFYRKALYLDPDHYEALIHLALLLERTGDAANARTFRRRAERAQPKP
jgi:chemotaxis protein methyltransferase WspC